MRSAVAAGKNGATSYKILKVEALSWKKK